MGRRGDGGVLGAAVQGAEEGEDGDGGGEAPGVEEGGGATDFGLARKKGENAALGFVEGAEDGGRDAVGDGGRGEGGIGKAGLDGPEGRPGGGDGGVGAKHARRGGGVEGGRHGQDAEVGAEDGAGVKGQGETEIGVQAALVEFVEDHEADVGEFGVGEEAAREESLGQDFDAGVGADGAFEAHLVADSLADGAPEDARHGFGGQAGGEAAGLKQEDFFARREPARGAQEVWGGEKGLAGAGRGLEDDGVSGVEGGGDGGERGGYGEVWERLVHASGSRKWKEERRATMRGEKSESRRHKTGATAKMAMERMPVGEVTKRRYAVKSAAR